MHTFWAWLIAVAGAGTLATAAWVLLGICALAWFSTHPPRRRVKGTPARFGAAYQEVSFTSLEGTMLSGWFIPARSDSPEETARGVIILCHGMMANRGEALPWAERLWKEGFALLLFDFRAMGNSEGELCTAGYYETQDVRGAVKYLATRPDTADLPMGVFGFSMGGATAILAAADEERILAVATHGAFATLDNAIVQRCRRHFGPLAPIVARGARLLANRWFPVSSALVSPVNVVSRLTPRPLMILHGSRDRVVNKADAHALHAAAGHPKQLHILPRSGHRRIHHSLRDEARQNVVEFFCEHFPTPSSPVPAEKIASSNG